MKTLIITTLLAISIASCNNKTKEADSTETTSTSTELYACSMHPEVTGKKGSACSKCGMELTEAIKLKEPVQNQVETKPSDTVAKTDVENSIDVASPSDYVNDIIISYINLKNMLVKDNSIGAAEKGKILLASLNRFDTKTLNAKQKKGYLDIADDAKENAEHIGDNARKIDHQREHFVLLSKDINDLIKMFGSSRKLYQDYCPMANNGKGAIWISEIKEIKNPYYGSEMLTCGSTKKEL